MMTRIIFSLNKDRKTVNMLVDDFIISEDIPFIPRLSVDHRGAALYFYGRENGLGWEDFELDESTLTPSEVKRGYDYLSAPKYIGEAIIERTKTKSHDYRRA